MTRKQFTEPGFTDRPVHGRAFLVSATVIGGMALIQMFAFVFAILRRESVPPPGIVPLPETVSPVAVISRNPPPEAEAAPTMPPPAVSSPSPTLSDVVVKDPVAPSPLIPAPSESGPKFLGPAGEPSSPPGESRETNGPAALFASLVSAGKSQVLEDGILERLLVTGAELRASGNTQGALRNFREVESALPEHPRVLSEIAATLGLLGLKDKQQGYWERVEALGPAGAGPYFAFALEQLGKAKPVPPAAPKVASAKTPEENGGSADRGKQMKIGEIKVTEEAPTSEGQKVSLSVVIDAAPGSDPAGEDLSLLVYFFDRVPSGEVKPTTANTSYLYPTEPYDWKVNGTETIVVNYLQPTFTAQQKRELGERTYHGYVIELYYRDELQDKVAMPEDVAALRFDPSSTAGAPAPAAGGDVKPENALFPNPAVP